MSPSETAQCVRQVLAGDKEAFARLISAFERMVFALAWQEARQPAEADDMAQETFLRAYRDLARLRRPEGFASWLYGIALNVGREYRRRRPDTVPLDDIPEPAARHEPGLTDMEARMMALVAELPDRYRIPLTLFYVSGRSCKEIARDLDLNEATARSLVHRARAMVRDRLTSQES